MKPYYEDEWVTLYHGDCREMGSVVPAESVHLTVTSPPYADLVNYGTARGQMGALEFRGWRAAMLQVLKALRSATVEGGRIAANVGDVCLARRKAGRHRVLPLAAALSVDAHDTGWDYLTPIRWEKIANVSLEASTSSGVLGKPNQPGGIIKSDFEHILLFRKPGSYRQPTSDQVAAAHIDSGEYAELFRGVWRGVPGDHNPDHPATFPYRIPSRLIRMFSFPSDIVLDPFAGSGTTLRAAKDLGRRAVGFEVEERYCEIAARRLCQDVLDFGEGA